MIAKWNLYVSDFSYFCAVEHIEDFLMGPVSWFLRWKKRKGFGIQSPFVYNFVLDVVDGGGEYYAYAPLYAERVATLRSECKNPLRLDRFLFRLANFVQPKTMFVTARGTDISRRYLSEGCKGATTYVVRTIQDAENMLKLVKTVDLIYLDGSETAAIWFLLKNHLSEKSAVFIRGIHSNRQQRAVWEEIRDGQQATLTFDLWMGGLALFNPEYQKHHYKLSI